MLRRSSSDETLHICSFLREPPGCSVTHCNTIRADDLPVVRDELELIQPSLGSRDWGCPVTPAGTGGKGVTDDPRRHQSCLAGPAAHSDLGMGTRPALARGVHPPTGLAFIYRGVIGLPSFGEQEAPGGLFCLLHPWE